MDRKKLVTLMVVFVSFVMSLSVVSAAPLSMLQPNSAQIYRQGNYFYSPLGYDVNYSQTYISPPTGIIPDQSDGILASAPVFASRIVEIAAMYRYTHDENYKLLYEKTINSLPIIKSENGFMPYYFTIYGQADTFINDRGILHDAKVLGGLLIGTKNTLPTDVSITRLIPFTYSNGIIYSSSTEESNNSTNSSRLKVEYTISNLNTLNISVNQVWGVTSAGEEKLDLSNQNIKIIEDYLKTDARTEYLSVVAKEKLWNPDIKEGVITLNGNNILSQLGAQTFNILGGTQPDIYRIVRYGKETSARNLLKECSGVCLYRGAIYIPYVLHEKDMTQYTNIPVTGDNLKYLTKISQGWVVSNGGTTLSAKSDILGPEPHYGVIAVTYHPIRSYIIHYAGSLESMVYRMTGSQKLSLNMVYYAQKFRIPTGEYSITSQIPSNSTANLSARVPWNVEAYSAPESPGAPWSQENLILVSTMSWNNAMALRQEAFREENAMKLFKADDNLLAMSIDKSPSSIFSQEITAMLSLSKTKMMALAQSEAQAENNYEVNRYETFNDFRNVFHEIYLPIVQQAATQDVVSGQKTADNAVLIAQMANKGERADIPGFYQLYSAYEEYFSNHTKNYTTLKALINAGVDPAAAKVVQKIEEGQYGAALTLTNNLSGADVKRILIEEISTRQKENSAKLNEAVASLTAFAEGKNSLNSTLSNVQNYLDSTKIRNLKMTSAEEILKAAQNGAIPIQNARKAIAGVFGSSSYVKPVAQPKKVIQKTQKTQSSNITKAPAKRRPETVIIIAAILVILSGIVVAALKLKGRPPAQGR